MALGSSGRSQYRLLVAEDDQALRDMLVAVLRSEGYEVVAVANGLELLTALKAAVDSGREELGFDLVISDIRMPGSSGPHAFARLGRVPRLPPVMFMTAFGDEEVREEAIQVGAVAVLDKPVDLDELRVFVSSCLEMRCA
jgi:CheY-like chemotaxis protein